MCSASCGFENPDRVQCFPPRPPVSIAAPLLAHAPTPGPYTPWHLSVHLMTSPSALESQRTQVVMDPGVMEGRDEL
jgi:hypothetical protein